MILHTTHELLELAIAKAPTAAIASSMRRHGAAVYRTGSGWIVETAKGHLIAVTPDERLWKMRVHYPVELPKDAIRITGDKL